MQPQTFAAKRTYSSGELMALRRQEVERTLTRPPSVNLQDSSEVTARIRKQHSVLPSEIVPYTIPIYTGTPPNNNAAKAFVLSCIDPRYANATEQFLLSQLGSNGFTYDLFTLAGSSLGGNNDGNSPWCGIANTNWSKTLLDHVQLAITLHNVSQFLVIDHSDCGAFTSCLPEGIGLGGDALSNHVTQFNTLSGLIRTNNFHANSTNTLTPGSNVFTAGISGLFTDTTGCVYNLTNPLVGPPIQCDTVQGYGANVLVLGCIDPRFTEILSSFLVNYKMLQFNYDLFNLAGAALGANQSYNTSTTSFPVPRGNGVQSIDYPLSLIAANGAGIGNLGETWGRTFFDHVSVAVDLHKITEVWVFDHLDCGAYKAIKFGNLTATDNDINQHTTEIVKLHGYIQQQSQWWWGHQSLPPTLEFKGFVIDMQGGITQVAGDPIPLSSTVPFNKKGSSTNMVRWHDASVIQAMKTGSAYRTAAAAYVVPEDTCTVSNVPNQFLAGTQGAGFVVPTMPKAITCPVALPGEIRVPRPFNLAEHFGMGHNTNKVVQSNAPPFTGTCHSCDSIDK
jgi:carbonic anhydrase